MPLDDDALGELLDGLGIGLELNAVAPEVEPLLGALILQAPRTALQQAAVDAAEAVWSDELETELAQEQRSASRLSTRIPSWCRRSTPRSPSRRVRLGKATLRTRSEGDHRVRRPPSTRPGDGSQGV
jgi:hypothetical protein